MATPVNNGPDTTPPTQPVAVLGQTAALGGGSVFADLDHAAIRRWRREQMLRTTLARRPDLLHTAALDDADRALLRALGWEPRGGGRPDDG